MVFLWIGLGLVLFLLAMVLGISYYCYRSAFFFDRRIKRDPEEFDLPHGTVYEPFYDHMIEKMKEMRATPHRDYSTTAFDGLTLWGTFYEFKPGAPIELMFHGYKGSGERDLCGGVQRCFVMGHSAFIIDQRGSGRSGGKVCTFGINERRDCHSWIAFLKKEFGEDVKIILTGVSMGAATVMMAAAEPLPSNVKGILADCGYSSPGEIIRLVMERQGFIPDKVSEQPMTYLPTLFAGAFMAHHRNIKAEEIEKIYARLPNKHDLIGKLVEMYNDPIMTLLDDPDEHDEGNMSWTAGW